MTKLPRPRQPGELRERQAQLQREAAEVLDDLSIIELASSVGQPVQVGSVALGLMVWRDIDLTVLCPQLDLDAIFELGGRIAAHERVRALQWRNDTGYWNQDPMYPDGFLWGVGCRSEAGADWALDVWFIHEDTRQPDMQHLESFLPRLTDETRLAILTIKDVWRRTPAYGREVSSYDCYIAVLDHGVRTVNEFEAYLAGR
jgi:hypothetical protein